MSPYNNPFGKYSREEILELIDRDLFFTNSDCYDSEADWLVKLAEIITDGSADPQDVGDEFISCCEHLISKGYLVDVRLGEDIIRSLNSAFDRDIGGIEGSDHWEAVFRICDTLKDSGEGLLNLYSAGDFDCYAIVSSEKIRQLKELFEPLFQNYMQSP